MKLQVKIFDMVDVDDLAAIETELNDWLQGKDVHRLMAYTTQLAIFRLLIFYKSKGH